jgi:hypothetical protein
VDDLDRQVPGLDTEQTTSFKIPDRDVTYKKKRFKLAQFLEMRKVKY